VLIRDHRAGHWLQLTGSPRVLTAHTPDAVLPVVAAAERLARDAGQHVVGFIAYEAAGAMDAALDTHPRGRWPLAWFAGFTEARMVELPDPPPVPPTLDWRADVSPAAYRSALARIRGLIGAGDTYQVNFSYRLRTQLEGPWIGRLEALFAGLVQRQPDGLGAFIETDDWAVLCASHELFFTREGTQIVSRPMKGTAARGADRSEDRAQADWLAASAKNRAENLMITDMVRNDLGRIARTGSVRTRDLFALERHPTLWQMTSTVTAESDAGLADLLRALFPAASITGAPKRRAMEIIRELETTPRELYTGSIGYLRPDGSAQFNVAIRTMLVDKTTGDAEYGVGGGIVWDSDPDAEYTESRTKALILRTPTPPFELLETLRWTPDAGYRNRTEHLERLAAAADYFGYPFDFERLAEALAAAVRAFPPRPRRVRLLLRRSGEISISDGDLTPLPDDYRVALCPVPLAVAHDPFVRHKTTHRALYDQARKLVPGIDDVLLWNARGELTESTIANVVLELDGEWVTPPVTSGLLPGVGRRLLLESGRARERLISTSDLKRATGLALVNSLRGWWPARLVDPPEDGR